MTRLVVYSHVSVGAAMSSPGIRCYHLARELAADFEVTLMIPNRPDFALEGVDVRHTEGSSPKALNRVLERFDVVVAQKLPIPTMRHLARSRTRLIYDLYTPAFTESLAVLAADGAVTVPRLLARAEHLTQQFALATGDALICPSERQRDLWVGVLAGLGRIDLETYRRDRTLRSLIDVVPFGLPADRPVASEPALKGVVPGIRASDRVLLWLGGLVDWTDPLTVIRAVARIARSRDDVKLLVVGFAPPNEAPPPMAKRALELARSLGVLDRAVFFHEGWVSYERRQGFLLEADLGVAAYFDDVESRFAFRARLLDYFWAGLPTVTTRGDELGDLVAERELGRAVDFEDVDGWPRAIEELLAEVRAKERIGENLVRVRDELAWPAVVAPLRRLAAVPGAPVRGTTAGMSLEDLWLRLRLSYGQRGPAGLAKRQAGKLLGRGRA